LSLGKLSGGGGELWELSGGGGVFKLRVEAGGDAVDGAFGDLLHDEEFDLMRGESLVEGFEFSSEGGGGFLISGCGVGGIDEHGDEVVVRSFAFHLALIVALAAGDPAADEDDAGGLAGDDFAEDAFVESGHVFSGFRAEVGKEEAWDGRGAIVEIGAPAEAEFLASVVDGGSGGGAMAIAPEDEV